MQYKRHSSEGLYCDLHISLCIGEEVRCHRSRYRIQSSSLFNGFSWCPYPCLPHMGWNIWTNPNVLRTTKIFLSYWHKLDSKKTQNWDVFAGKINNISFLSLTEKKHHQVSPALLLNALVKECKTKRERRATKATKYQLTSIHIRPVHKNLFLEFPRMPGSFMLRFDR